MTMYPPPPQGAVQNSGASGPRAGFWARFFALLLDTIIVAIVPLFVIIIGATSKNGGILGLGYLLFFAMYIAYFVYFEGGPSGQTYGKRALGIRVIDFNTGGPIGHGRAFLRLIVRWISGAVCYLGYLWMLWDKEKQCWHDKAANDVVVPVSAYPLN